MSKTKPRALVVAGLGVGQILAWGSSYYLLAVLAEPVAEDTGWSAALVVGGLSIGLVISGLISPRVGSRIGQGEGRTLLLLSAFLLSAGLSVLAAAANPWVYLVGWLVMGMGMATGLYTSAFATLGHLYGESARTSITALTLFGGFASTVCWPLSTLLVSEVGWRWTCGIYAILHLVVTIPIYFWVLPRGARLERRESSAADPETPSGLQSGRRKGGTVVLVASVVTLGGFVSTMMSVHLFAFLGAAGLGLGAALAIATLVGPSQVGARLLELAVAQRHHPLWTMVASTGLVALGIGVLAAGLPLYVLIVAFYGAGIGLASIAHGTVPLALFGAKDYPSIVGKIAMPALLAQAAAPTVGALFVESIGARNTTVVLAVLAVVNVILVVWLTTTYRRRIALSTVAVVGRGVAE